MCKSIMFSGHLHKVCSENFSQHITLFMSLAHTFIMFILSQEMAISLHRVQMHFRQIYPCTYVGGGLSSLESCWYVLDPLKSQCCHLTPKRGRLKGQPLQFPYDFVCQATTLGILSFAASSLQDLTGKTSRHPVQEEEPLLAFLIICTGGSTGLGPVVPLVEGAAVPRIVMRQCYVSSELAEHLRILVGSTGPARYYRQHSTTARRGAVLPLVTDCEDLREV